MLSAGSVGMNGDGAGSADGSAESTGAAGAVDGSVGSIGAAIAEGDTDLDGAVIRFASDVAATSPSVSRAS